ncbi:hypothetical protein [Lentilactobacillus sp. SPB1-3]|uniref:Uncharacterized protein n=1 Tax=Lentilactobacillus terminaliae TaxID=3003483 RepID=A0ACD5DD68_9LACO|nr:hypothetical protein [Lentilactobacillus sp. SPB1-3]MCZ0978105.1 hypothetical protein [Lentilactobacillus sp. SPB1-3]
MPVKFQGINANNAKFQNTIIHQEIEMPIFKQLTVNMDNSQDFGTVGIATKTVPDDAWIIDDNNLGRTVAQTLTSILTSLVTAKDSVTFDDIFRKLSKHGLNKLYFAYDISNWKFFKSSDFDNSSNITSTFSGKTISVIKLDLSQGNSTIGTIGQSGTINYMLYKTPKFSVTNIMLGQSLPSLFEQNKGGIA